jgi:hypothetical protein
MSGLEGREKEIADAIRAKLRERGIGIAELREIAASRAVHRKDDSSGGGGGQRCKEQYCAAFSDDPVLGPVLGSLEAGHLPKEVLDNMDNLTGIPSCPTHDCPQNFDGDRCVDFGNFCSYACRQQGQGYTLPQAFICNVPTPQTPFICGAHGEAFDCVQGDDCPDADSFGCNVRYESYNKTCDYQHYIDCHSGGNFACSSKTAGEGFNCQTTDHFICDSGDWFSCFNHFYCGSVGMFTCQARLHHFCRDIHICPNQQVACGRENNFTCDILQGAFHTDCDERWNCDPEGHFNCTPDSVYCVAGINFECEEFS